jgi:Tat protein secretion system quality control protein TatD with DNase activity
VTKSLQLLADIQTHLKIRNDDPELDQMLKRTNQYAIEKAVVKQIEKANSSISKQMSKEYPDVMEEGEKS